MAGSLHDRSAGVTPVFGREAAVGELARVLASARTGRGQGLLLTGPPGIGKSHFLTVTVERARAQEFRVLAGRALPDDLPPPFSLVRQLLAPAEVPAQRVGSLPPPVAVPPLLVPILGEALTGGAAVPEETPPPGSLDDRILRLGGPGGEGGGQGHQELILGAVGLLRDAARGGPLLVAVDDLQFADTSSLEVLRALSADLRRAPLAVVATLSEPAVVPDRVRSLLDEIRRSPAFRTTVLPPFNPHEVAEFLRWVSGGRVAIEADVLRWHAQTEGNPLFLENLVRSSIGYQAPGEPRGETGRDVAEVLRERVAALGEVDRRLLSYAVVLGKEFAFAHLLAVAGMSEDQGTESLDRLAHGGLIRERGNEVYEFVSEALRTELYMEITETRRRILHLKSGRALEARGASDSVLARHFFLGRDDEKAVEYNQRAAQAAVVAFDYDTAASHLARGLEAERRRPERTRETELHLLIELGRLLDELGNLPRSDDLLAEAVELARREPGHDLALGRALLALAQTRVDRSEYASASALATEAIGLLALVGNARDLMAAHRVLGTVSWRLGHPADAEAHQREALEIARREGSPSEVGHALIDLANSMTGGGPEYVAAAQDLYGQAAELFGAEDDHASRARVLMNRAVMHYAAREEESARRDLTQAIESAERSRSPIWIGYCYLNLAQIDAETGHPSEARHALDRAVDALGRLGDRLAAQQVAMTRGMVAATERDFEAADLHFAEALAQARSLGMGAEETEVLARTADLARLRGDATSARSLLAEARARGDLARRPDLSERIDAVERALPAGTDPQR